MASLRSLVAVTFILSTANAGVFQLQQESSRNRVHLKSGRINSETSKAPVQSNLVDSEALQASIKSQNLLERAEYLFDLAKLSEHEYNHPTRVIGSAGHQGTLDWIYSEISKLGSYYSLSNQTFQAFSGNVIESRLVLGNTVPSSASPFGLTPPTKHREPVFGRLVLIGNEGCKPVDYPDLTGKIALIKRGTCAFTVKSELAGKKGALAAVVYNDQNGSLSGTLGTPLPDHVATFGISAEEAAPFVEKLKQGASLDGIAYIDGEVRTIDTYNILAETAQGDKDNCILVGAHSDSVDAGPGINDDGSGTMSLLEVATQLTKFSVKNCVRFGWWAGEEEGLLGSDYYANKLSPEENLKVRAFLDYDMMASPNFAYQIYNSTNEENPAGSEQLRDLYVDWYKAHGIPYTFIEFDGRSDYDGFIRNGIPASGIATGAEGIKTKEEAKIFGGVQGEWYDPCYHQLCDDVGNLNMTAWEVNTKLIAHSVATYALSFDGFPKRDLGEGTSVAEAKPVGQRKYHGPKLFI